LELSAKAREKRILSATLGVPENNIPDSADPFFAFKARNPANNILRNGLRDVEGGRKGKLDGMFLDRNLSIAEVRMAGTAIRTTTCTGLARGAFTL